MWNRGRCFGFGTVAAMWAAVAVTAASAQSTSVGASLVGTIVRSASSEVLTARSVLSGEGESLGFGVNVQRGLTDRWGLALEFTRPGVAESETVRPSSPTFGQTVAFATLTERRDTSVAALAFYRQPITSRISLSYTAGISFIQLRYQRRYEARGALAPLVIPSLLVPAGETYTDYGVGPIIGLDARIGLWRNLSLVPGVRLQGSGGWLIQPAVGAQWQF